MNKRLILVLALAFVVGIAFTASAEVQNVKVSGDLTFLGLSRSLYLTAGSAKDENAMATIARVRVDADLTDNVVATVRLLNERYWGNETQHSGTSGVNTNVDLDLAYVALKEFLYSPLSVTVGRQELHFGNDMIVGDPDTNNAVSAASPFSGGGAWPRDPDLSVRKSFDAVRATLDYNPLVIDVIGATLNKSALQRDSAETLFGVNANYALSKKATLEAYYFERRRGKKFATNNKIDKTDVIGARIAGKPMDNMSAQLEGAYQFGTQVNALGAAGVDPTQQRSAFAIESSLTYDFAKVKYSPSLTALYNYFSGNKSSGKKRNTAWDPMYENQTAGHIANALFNQSNVHILGAVATAKPMDDISLKGEYYAYWWDKKFGAGQAAAGIITAEPLVMSHHKTAAQEIDVTLSYDYTEDVQLSLLGGYLMTGNSFDKQNRNNASEVIGSMKVTF